uniref:Translation initiation factor eIF2B subunit alpha n=1 Tax=Denticeps clupeoides TaxID=299321 RepID=A0AAY4AR27_9TELE
MDERELVKYFRTQISQDPDVASAAAAIRSLLEFLKRDQISTVTVMLGFLSCHSTTGGGRLFCGRVFRRGAVSSLYHSDDFSQSKNLLVERGELFLNKISLSRNKVAKLCHTFIKDGAKILTHSSSRVVLKVLENAAADKKRFSVYVTESQPDSAGKLMAEKLRRLNIPVTVILDAAVGYIMEKVNLVIVGAEGVVESGGIINKIGTYQLAVCSKAHNKPFYVVAESFKFVRLFPLNQQDVPAQFKYKADILKTAEDLDKEHPMIDYTPPSLITLLFTDLGVLTPSAVSDELIKIYL